MKTDRLSNYYWHLGLVSFLAVAGAIASSYNNALAEITPDSSLGAESSVVIPNVNINGTSSDLIDGGANRGTNLFHSFQEFNINEGAGAYFTNPSGIENILSRVTGGNPSKIFGKLGVLGNANLFLINSNGIIFGQNASLELGGSFVGSTATSLNFADGTSFSANTSQTTPILSVSVPTGLQFGATPGNIVNQSRAASSFPSISPTVGLQVLPGRTLALVGGDVVLVGGQLTAPGGRIELGSVAGSSLVNFKPQETNLTLEYQSVPAFKNIQMSGGASLNTSGLGGGSIQLQGGRIALTEGANIIADTFGNFDGGGINIQANHFTVQNGAFLSASTFGAGAAGNISLTVSDSVELIGNGRFDLLDKILNRTFNPVTDRTNGLFAISANNGAAGNLTINTQNLTLRDGAAGLTGTLVEGQGGNLSVTASKSVELVNSGLLTGTTATKTAGNIAIDTKELIVRDGAILSTSTLGNGAGGTINVRADIAILKGSPVNALIPTGIAATTDSGIGVGGNIAIDVRRLSVRDGAVISTTSGRLTREGIIPVGGQGGNLTVTASDAIELTGISADGRFQSIIGTTTFSPSQSGNLNISTKKLTIRDGAVVSTATVGAGKGGTLVVNASDAVEVIGRSADGRSQSGLEATSGSTFFPISATGASGDLSIATGKLIVRDGAEIAVSSLGLADAGNLEVVADSISLNSGGTISATSARSGNGGNIALQVKDLLQLRHNGQISSTAGTAQAGGDGGNININAKLIVALENSAVAANAFTGRGGNVEIGTQGLFLSPDSPITASSEQGTDGIVEIRTPDVELQNSLTQLAANFASPDSVVAGSCLARRNVDRGSFTITGTGGLPSNPYEAISSRYELGIQPIERGDRVSTQSAVAQTAPWQRGEPIQEAQGMVVTADGRTIVGINAQLASIVKAKNLICP